MKKYQSNDIQIWFKIIKGKPHPTFRDSKSKHQTFDLGIAFRTYEAPIGYFPFYGAKDFDLSGETSFKEEILSRMPIDLSSVASPHSLLIKETAGDVEFLGSGDSDLEDIQQLVKIDLLKHAMAAASGVFIDGVMMSLGGPGIQSLVNQLIKSKVKRFILSKSISGAAKNYLKKQANFDADKLLNNIP